MNFQTVTVIAVIGLVLASITATALVFILRELRMAREDQRRHTHSTTAGIEDALAVAYNVRRLAEESEFQARAQKEASALIQSILGDMREGPYSYDPNRPSGDRSEAVTHASRRSA